MGSPEKTERRILVAFSIDVPCVRVIDFAFNHAVHGWRRLYTPRSTTVNLILRIVAIKNIYVLVLGQIGTVANWIRKSAGGARTFSSTDGSVNGRVTLNAAQDNFGRRFDQFFFDFVHAFITSFGFMTNCQT